MKAFRRILRYFFYAVAVVVAAAIGALVVLTTTERGRDNLAGIVSSLASSADSKVTIAGLDGIWSGALRVGHVVVEDRNGPWLVVRDAEIDWSPLALLSRTFRAERIAAGRIEVARLPVAGSEQKKTGGSTSLPVSVDIARIDLPDIALGKEVAGAGIAELSANGSAKVDANPLSVAGDLTVARRDGQQGTVKAKINFAPQDNRLDLDVTASEPAGGIIANLLKLPGTPAVDVVVSGSGPLADWQGSGTFSVDGQAVAQLTGHHQLTDKGHRVEAKGQGEFERFLPEMLKPLLVGKTDFDIAGTALGNGGVAIERASVESDAVHLAAKGTYDPQAATDISLELAARSAPVVLSLPTGGPPVTVAIKDVTARAFGDGKEPMVDVAGNFVSIITGGTEVHDLAAQIHSDGFDIGNRSGPVKIGLAAGTLKTDVATLAPLAAGRVTVDLAGTVSPDQITLDEGVLRSGALNASVNATLSLADLAMTLGMKADAVSSALPPQLKPVLGERVQFSATATRDPKGSFAANTIELTSGSLKASGTASASGTEISADLKGSLGDVSPLSGLARTDLAGGVNFALKASGARTAPDFSITASSDKLVASGKTVTGLSLTATGKADIAAPVADVSLTGSVEGKPLNLKATMATTDGKMTADVKGDFGDLSVLSEQVAGAVGFTIKAEGEATAPNVSFTLNSAGLTVAGHQIAGLELTAVGKADVANPAADVKLKGDVSGQPLNGTATLRTVDGRREIKGLALTLGPGRIGGDLVLDDKFLPVGTLAIDLPQIGPLAALAAQKVEGDLKATVRFSSEDGKPQVAVKANAGRIVRDGLSAAKVAIDALVADYTGTPTISGTIKAGGVVSGSTAVSDIAIDLKRDGEWTAFSGGATVKDIPAKAAGRVKVADSTVTLELASAEANLRGIKAALSKPTTIVVKDGVTRLDKLTIGIGSGSAIVTGTAGPALDLAVTLSSLPIALANNFVAGLDAAGSLSGTVKVSGAAANPSVTYDIKGTGIQAAQSRGAGLGGVGLTSAGTFAANKLTFNATASEGSGIGLKAGGTVTLAGTPALALDISGRVPFGFLAAKLAQQGLSLNGSADVALAVRGSVTTPDITGSVTTAGARFIHAGSGIAINDIGARVTFGGKRATIEQLTGNLSTGGKLAVSGSVGIDPAGGFPADLAIKLADGRYSDGRLVTANFSGDLAVKGQLALAPVISGTVNLGRTVVTVPDRLPGSISALDVKRKGAPAAVRAQDKAMRPETGATGGGGGGGPTLDVTVNAPNQIFVQGRGLDAELGGNIRLTGPASAPQAVGQFNLLRGRLSILGKRLTFTQGTMTFSGSLVPYISLAAQTTATDATVTISITGEATNPKFAFTSVPALPEDEVMARLIFGRSMSNLSPLQIAQLADAVAQLTGAGGSSSLLQKLQGSLGIDDLDVNTDEKGGTSVSAGKYLNDRTYVTIQKGEKPGSGKARIDLDVGRGVKLRGEASDAGEAKGGIFYEREY
ncbi:MAG: translocation/assembly module TamB [Mesorhizobium sp.]|nr:translocation/assembly module TamB domain-containing protein [Mesorhizobium sp.]MBN9243259.1 translocation/assembly module TamB [Mesorhizobium sp.]